ncbi:hypothetical protein DFH07DRAFT_763084 [Mycena maculata]|uniref:SUN domain-containing protein n=1 Tax=Mycena maculata TaxID=230809 RepID=A0AAD7MEY6_9AGAR|nr:hypothetical protein DFH07DRAFT_763084 [Mycena maculata]
MSADTNSLRKDLEPLQLLFKLFQPPQHVARPDFALHLSGASVIPSLTSQTYTLHSLGLLGYLTGQSALVGRPPVTALHHDIHDGNCWPFAGSQGQLGIVLASPTHIDSDTITIDHVAAAAAVNKRTSTSKYMELWDLVEGEDNVSKLEAWRAVAQPGEDEPVQPAMLPKFPEYIQIASFQYDIHLTNNIQTFPIDAGIRSLGIDFGVVVLMVKSNWGRDEYTCLYRVRVHGEAIDIPVLPEVE